ncbi:MAG: DUF6327 family protein [Capnocytophaga sp.]|nr:DUF6327 family protein [Capnocytophaga sp.]
MKTTNNYISFEEIEQQLRVLKLKKQVDMLCLKDNVSQVKENLTPSGIVSGIASGLNLGSLTGRKHWFSWLIEIGVALINRRR